MVIQYLHSSNSSRIMVRDQGCLLLEVRQVGSPQRAEELVLLLLVLHAHLRPVNVTLFEDRRDDPAVLLSAPRLGHSAPPAPMTSHGLQAACLKIEPHDFVLHLTPLPESSRWITWGIRDLLACLDKLRSTQHNIERNTSDNRTTHCFLNFSLKSCNHEVGLTIFKTDL